jgi:hypothetical protein
MNLLFTSNKEISEAVPVDIAKSERVAKILREILNDGIGL